MDHYTNQIKMEDLRLEFIENRIKELQDSTDFVNNLLRRITGYSIIVGDFDGNILVFNEGAHRIFGFTPQETVGIKNIEDFFPVSFVKAGKLNWLFDKLVQSGEHLYELDRERKNGEVFPGQSLLTLVQDNERRLVGFVEITQDITERKIAREKLENANQKLIELNRQKDDFLSIASHELRTPLTSIKSFTEILLNYDEDQDTRKEFLGIINFETDRLIRIITDFLDISKIEAGRMQWHGVELSLPEVVRQTLQTINPLIVKSRLELILKLDSELPQVFIDKDRLVQVITNLLGNAVKFTPEGGKILIKAYSTPADNSSSRIVTFSITDSGIGIAPENYSRIFENFGQVGNVLKDRPRGTGLGLPISKKIIEYFGGKIWVESQVGTGSTFFFSLPAINQSQTDLIKDNLSKQSLSTTSV